MRKRPNLAAKEKSTIATTKPPKMRRLQGTSCQRSVDPSNTGQAKATRIFFLKSRESQPNRKKSPHTNSATFLDGIPYRLKVSRVKRETFVPPSHLISQSPSPFVITRTASQNGRTHSISCSVHRACMRLGKGGGGRNNSLHKRSVLLLLLLFSLALLLLLQWFGKFWWWSSRSGHHKRLNLQAAARGALD